MTFTPMPFRDDGRASVKDWWNILLFVILSLVFGYLLEIYIIKPRQIEMAVRQAEIAQAQQKSLDSKTVNHPPRSVESVLSDSPRETLENKGLRISIGPVRPRLDDVVLKGYLTSLEKKDPVHLMMPAGTDHPAYGETGWVSDDPEISLPGPEAIWVRKGSGNDKETVLEWKNENGLLFKRTFSIDDQYLITIKDEVQNGTEQPVKLWPYAILSQEGLPSGQSSGIVHEGAIGYVGDTYIEHSFRQWSGFEQTPQILSHQKGWVGITSRYFLMALLSDQKETMVYRTVYRSPTVSDPYDKPHFQMDMQGIDRVVKSGETAISVVRVYVGPKTLRLLESYEKELGLTHFDLAVDFGWFYFLTKPFYYVLVYLNDFIGNFGVAILALTFLLRLAVFPLANTSFRSFAKMKKIQPQIQDLQKQYLHDKKKMQEELVKLYTREKVNPVSGCLPLIAQIPIFFAMYKVINVAIEMRHAPFFGWITDLSAPDPTSLFNLFGLLPYAVPSFLNFGVWPFVLFVLIMIQVRLNPPPADKMMQVFFNYYYPVIICLTMSRFASGLVIYWGFSALLSVIQQMVIMRAYGVPIHLFERLKRKGT